MKKWISLISVLLLGACDETNVTSTAEIMNLVAERDSSEPLDSLDAAAIESIDTVRSIYSLGACTEDRSGTIMFVLRDDAYYICKDADWHQTELPEELMVETSSSLEESSSSENELEESSSSFEELSSSEMQSSSSQEESSSSAAPSSSSSQKASSSSVTQSSSSQKGSSSSVTPSSSSQKVSSSSATPSSSSQKVSSSSVTPSSSSQKVSSSSATPSSSSQKVSSSSATPSSSSQKVSSSSATPSSSSQKVSSSSATPSSSSQKVSSSSTTPSSSSQTPSSSSAPPSSSSQTPSSSSAPPSSSSQTPSSSSAPPSSSSQVPSSSSAPPSSSSVESSSSVVADNYDCAYFDCVTKEYLNQEILAAGGYGEYQDMRDSQVYRTITIGTQTWMAQNLNYAATESRCYQDNDSNCTRFGRLYYQHEADTVCPAGWHLPSNAEWNVLDEYVDAHNGSTGNGNSLKSLTWTTGQKGTDQFGFSGIASHYFGSVLFCGSSTHGLFWTSDVHEYRCLLSDNSVLYYYRDTNSSLWGMAVRCLKN